MNKWIRKLTRTSRRGLACATAAALVLSTLATAPSAGAASKKKPTLNVKKKTLYWNKAGKKNYTLKMKKNKVRMIIATTWKTSKKSVVALSKKKETSVRLTAKKKGKATITATVKYVPAKKWEVKTAKLTCKVTSKGTEASTPQPTDAPVPTYPFPMFSMPAQSFMPQSTATAKPEETPGADGSAIPDTTPGADESEKPDETEKPSGAPEETPGGDFVVSEVVLSETEALLGVTEGKNSVTLTAEVRDQDGEPVENADVTWTSDDEDVAVVSDGIVEAVQGGTANITASVNGVTSQPCVVTVDDQRPVIEGAVLSDYKTFSVYFSEPVTGDPEVSVTEGDTDVAYDSLHLSEDGKSMAISYRNALRAGEYEIILNGLSDLAGNEMEPDAFVSVEKEASRPESFVCKTEQAPAGQSSFDVYYSIVDQYGEECDSLGVMSEGTLTATAQTENGMPFKTQVKQAEGYIKVIGSASAFKEGRKIKISLVYSVKGETAIEGEMVVTLVNAADKGKAVEIAGLSAVSETMKNSGTPDEPVFQLTGVEADNVFMLSAKLLDEFGYEANPSDVIYMIEDESVLAFSDADGTVSDGISTSNHGVAVKARKGGKTTIMAYLAEDDSKSCQMTVTVKSTDLQKITVAELGEGTNGKLSEAKVTLSPDGTGLTKADLMYRVTAGEERLEDLRFVQEADGIYINITAKTDGKDDPIKFIVYSNGTESNVITYDSRPLLTTAKIEIDEFKSVVTAGGEASTTYRLRNRYGEDITKLVEKQPIFEIGNTAILKSAEIGTGAKAGMLTVLAEATGTTEIKLYMDASQTISEKISVTVKARAHVQKIKLNQMPDEDNDWLALRDSKILYVPIQLYNQYGDEYEKFTKEMVEENKLEITVDNKPCSIDSDIEVSWYRKNGDSYTKATAAGDIVDAIGIRWNSSKSPEDIVVENGDLISVSFINRRHPESFEADVFAVSVRGERRIGHLKFASDCKVAVKGAQATNTITVEDQYHEPIALGDSEIAMEITLNNTPVEDWTLTKTPDGSSGSTYKHTTKGKEIGEYTVRAYVKETAGTEFKDAAVKASYTLYVNTAETLITRLEIADIAKIDGKDVNISNQCVNVRGGATFEFDCKAYTMYNGKEQEVELKDALGEVVNSDNGLAWEMRGTENVTIQKAAAFGQFNVTIAGGAATDNGSVTVSLGYVPGGLQKERSVQVSREAAKPQGKHQIVTLSEGVPGSDDITGTDYPMTKGSPGVTFALMDEDQYGDVYSGISLYTVTSSDSGAVKVEIGKNGGVNTNKFTVICGENAVIGKTYTINVYVTSAVSYRFTVTVKEPVPEEPGLKLDKTELALEVGGTGMLTATGVPVGETVTWTSDDESVATVENGVVTAVAEGTATITATAGGKSATCKVTVTKAGSEQVTVTGVSLDEATMELSVGGTGTLNATVTVTPEGVEAPEVTWISDDESVATVENGVVTAVAEGTAIITAEAGGKTATCKVTVTKAGSE